MNILLESGARPFRSGKGAAISMVLHAAIITAAVIGTGKVVLPPREKIEEHPILYVSTPPPPEIHVAPEPLPAIERPPASKAPRVARPRIAPPPKRAPAPRPRPAQPAPTARTTPALVAPVIVPVAVPAVDLKGVPTVSDVVGPPTPPPARPTEARTGGTAGGAADGDVSGVSRGKGELGSGDAGRAFSESQVDRAVSVTRAADPRYPESLRSVSVEGQVSATFIVDAKGRVEPASIKVLSATHRLFGDAVRTALLNTRYRPAEAGGQAVRQLVEQSFTFRLKQ